MIHCDDLFSSPQVEQAATTFAQRGSGASASACHSAGAAVDYAPPTKNGSKPAERRPLVCIIGPTGSGKSALAGFLAEQLSGEVINYDSVQLYRGLDIGSGKVSLEERLRVAHHLLDVAEPGEHFTAGRYRLASLQVIESVVKRGNLPILAGGTGLYLRALVHGLFDGPERSERLRERLRVIIQRHSAEFIHRLLQRLDRAAAARIHPHDAQKTIRALEVCLLTGERMSSLQARGRAALTGFDVLRIGLNPERADLYSQINRRVDSMFQSGLIEETKAVLAQGGLSARTGVLKALGYRQALAVLDGYLTLQQAVTEAQAATRRYAKRQITWFRREPNVSWFQGFGDEPGIQREAMQLINQHFSYQATIS